MLGNYNLCLLPIVFEAILYIGACLYFSLKEPFFVYLGDIVASRLGDKQAVSTLTTALNDEDEEIREVAGKALEAIK